MPTDLYSDHDLLHSIKDDDKSAFDLLFKKYWRRLFVYLVKAIKDEAEAMDILQEVFSSLWMRRKDLPEMESFSPYLYSAVRLKGLSYVSKSANRNRLLDSLSSDQEQWSLSPEEGLLVKELVSFLNREIDELPPKMREVFRLSRFENLSYKEISEKLQISDKTVKKQINKALRFLKFRLREEQLFVWILLLLPLPSGMLMEIFFLLIYS